MPSKDDDANSGKMLSHQSNEHNSLQTPLCSCAFGDGTFRTKQRTRKTQPLEIFFSNNCSSVKPSKNEYQIEEGEGKKIPEGEIKGKMRT